MVGKLFHEEFLVRRENKLFNNGSQSGMGIGDTCSVVFSVRDVSTAVPDKIVFPLIFTPRHMRFSLFIFQHVWSPNKLNSLKSIFLLQ